MTHLLELDRDDAAVVQLLRDAVVDSGLSQAAFGRALGTSASRMSTYLSGRTRPSAQFLLRAQRMGAALHAVQRRRLASAPTTGLAMRKHFLVGRVPRLRDELLKGRRSLRTILADEDPSLADAWEAVPTPVGDRGWDVLLAAVVTHEHERAGRPVPAWARREPLPEPWSPTGRHAAGVETPEWLRRHNVYVPASYVERGLSQ